MNFKYMKYSQLNNKKEKTRGNQPDVQINQNAQF